MVWQWSDNKGRDSKGQVSGKGRGFPSLCWELRWAHYKDSWGSGGRKEDQQTLCLLGEGAELKLRGVIGEVGCDMPPRQLQWQKATEMRPAAFITAGSWHERARCKMLAGPEANRE